MICQKEGVRFALQKYFPCERINLEHECLAVFLQSAKKLASNVKGGSAVSAALRDARKREGKLTHALVGDGHSTA